MARYTSPGLSTALPKRTTDYLQNGAPEGTRNAELFDATCQFRDAGHPREEVEEQLLARAILDGLSEAEARQTIQSAFARTAREPAGGKPEASRNTPPPATDSGPPEPLNSGFLQLIESCFLDHEFVAIAPAAENDDGDVVPRRGVTLTAADWRAKVEAKGGIDRCFGTKLGLFVRINPMKQHGAKDSDVVAFRHALVEFDRDESGKPISKSDQYRAIVESGMPITVVIDSGNKSLHAWVRVDAPDQKEYKRRVGIIWDWFSGMSLDQQNRNPSRLSRCPEGWRTIEGEVRRQHLLATGLGAGSWDTWEGEHSKTGDPPFVDLLEFIENGCEPERPTVADVGLESCLFYAGRINEIHGEPGTGKSNVAIAASIEVMKSGGLVLYIDPEDTPAGFTRRCLQFGATRDDLVHRCRYLHNPMPDDITTTQRWAATHRPTLVVLDGMAESMGAEGYNEDKAPEVIQFIRDRIRPFAELAGAAVLISDHVAKSSEDRGRWARGSGAKLGRYDGVSYGISLIEAYAPGQAGAVKLTVAKDRNGGVGPTGRSVAEVLFAPGDGGRTNVSFRLPEAAGSFRPTVVMSKIVAHLKEHGEASKRDLRKLGKSQTVDTAIDLLREENQIVFTKQGRKHIYSLPVGAKSYSIGRKKDEDQDEESEA